MARAAVVIRLLERLVGRRLIGSAGLLGGAAAASASSQSRSVFSAVIPVHAT
jgi:hypothetical protein